MAPLVYSFAVFDACLVRLHARPLDQLFALAARVLPGTSGRPGCGPAGREDQHEFVRMRLRAEEEARDGPGLEAASLGRVYERFPRHNPWDLDPETLFATELEMALAGARPVPRVLERVRGHIRRGERVVYLTDSILPGPSLRRLLESHGFAGEVYAAGELGKRKGTGSLYLHMLAAESLDAAQLRHVGSDPVLDAKVPKSLGIHVDPIADVRFTGHEERLLSQQRACSPEASRVVAASRLARLGGEPSDPMTQVRSLAASVAAPALTAFTAWAMTDAARRGVERLYFLAREGQVLARLAQVLRPVIGGPEPRYLMGSLAAWTAPLLSGLSRTDLDWLAAEGQSRRPADLLARLALTPEELLGASGRSMPALLSEKPLGDEDLSALWDLLETPGSRKLLAAKASRSGEMLLDYLAKEGALEGPALAVADMGWTLSTQRALKMVLAERGIGVEGWYFGLASSRLGRMEAGPHHALFMERAAQALPGSIESVLFRNALLMERAFTRGDHGRVLGFERSSGGVRPVLGPEPPGVDFAREIQETALAFARTLAGGGWGEETFTALQETSRESLRLFLLEPDNAQARAVASLPGLDVPGDADGKEAKVVLRRIGLLDVVRAWLGGAGLRLAPRKPPRWIEGSAALSAAWLRPYLRRPRLMSLLREHFSQARQEQ